MFVGDPNRNEFSVANGKCTSSSRKRSFKLHTSLQDTGETFTVTKCCRNMKLSELKCSLEMVAGIPMDLQRLSYLDQGDLVDQTTIDQNDIIPGTTVTMAIWSYNGWQEVVQAAATGNEYKLKNVLSRRSAANGSGDEKSYWRRRHLATALYICAHRGHLSALRFLLHSGADVSFQTPGGRTALHVAAAEGRVACLTALMQAGVPKELKDADGATALDVARARGQTDAMHQLMLSQWHDRKEGMVLSPYLDPAELFAHQQFDSRLQTWYSGSHAQRYNAELGGREARGSSNRRKGAVGMARSTAHHHTGSPAAHGTSATTLQAVSVVAGTERKPRAKKQAW